MVNAMSEKRMLRLSALAATITGSAGIALALWLRPTVEGSGAFILIALGGLVALWALRPRQKR